MAVRRFEELVAWQKARVLTARVYEVTRRVEFARDLGLSNQIRRAAVSVMSNIAEGFERSGPGEFPHFLSIARAPSAEVRSQLYVALDAGYLEGAEFRVLLAQAEELSWTIGGLRTAVRRARE